MNNLQRGYSRDKEVIKALEQFKVLDTDQIAMLLFTGKAGRHKCQVRMQKLTTKKMVKRVRLYADTPYIYYLGERPKQIEHMVAVNWVLANAYNALGSHETMGWQYEPTEYKILRPDAFYGVEDRLEKRYHFYFVEADLSENKWDKVQKYNAMYEQELYSGQWWADKTEVFPVIICVTVDAARYKLILRSVEKENKHGLRFVVSMLSDFERRERKCSAVAGR